MSSAYSNALSGLNSNSQAINIVSGNLANLSTAGYKTEQVSFEDLVNESLGGYANSGSISGSTTVTISLGNVTAIALLPTNSSTTQGSTVQFSATATTSDGKTHDVTSSAMWNSSNTTAGTISSSGFFTAAATVNPAQTTTISATSGNITGQTILTVNP